MILKCTATKDCKAETEISVDEWAKLPVKDKIYLCENWVCGKDHKKEPQTDAD